MEVEADEKSRNALFGDPNERKKREELRRKKEAEEKERKEREQKEARNRELAPENYAPSKQSIDIESLDFSNLDLTTNDYEDLTTEIDGDIELLQHNPQVIKIIQEGKDLREYTKQVGNDLIQASQGTVEDYLKEGDVIADLFTEIIDCDLVLEQMERSLAKFQHDVSTFGTEIKKLQDNCLDHQVQIANRKGVQKQIHKFLEEVSITEPVHKTLTESEVNDAYLQCLLEFNKRINYVQHRKAAKNGNSIKAIQDIQPDIDKLSHQAVKKIKQFLLSKIHSCKSHEQIKVMNTELLKFGYLYQFLFKHANPVALEIQLAYEQMITKHYYSYYKTFLSYVSKLQYEITSKNDLIGVEESKLNKFLSGKKTIKYKTSVFSLGIRQHVIDELKGDEFHGKPLNTTEKQPYEQLFRAMLFSFVETVTSEIMFSQDFFLSPPDVESVFGSIMDKISVILRIDVLLLNIGQENLDQFVAYTHDAISTLILIATIQKFRVLVNKRLVSSLDGFFESLYSKLTNRFFYVFDMNVNSVKTAVAKDLSSMDFAPHYDMGDIAFVKRVNQGLARLRDEMEKLLIRLADAKHKDWKSKTMFLMNNFDLIVSIMNERGMSSVDGLQFQKFLDLKSSDFAQDELNHCFGRIMTFVKDHGRLVKNADSNGNGTEVEQRINAKEEEVETLMKEFHNNWKKEMEQIHDRIMKHFFNFKLGMKVFNLIMQELIDTYTIFVKLVKKYFRTLRMSKYFTPVTEITYELKRLFVTFE